MLTLRLRPDLTTARAVGSESRSVVGCSAGSSNHDSWQVVEAEPVGGHDDTAGGSGRGRDDEVTGAARSACPTDRHEQLGVHPSNLGVVADDGQGRDDVVEERSACLSALASGDCDADAELGDGDGRYRQLVVVGNERVQIEVRSLGADEDVGVQQEESQNRSCADKSSRSASSSRPQARSTRWRRRRAFASAPEVPVAGSSCAMTRPRRTIVYRSPRCSTPSSRSAKRLDASVAVTSVMTSDYQRFAAAAAWLARWWIDPYGFEIFDDHPAVISIVVTHDGAGVESVLPPSLEEVLPSMRDEFDRADRLPILRSDRLTRPMMPGLVQRTRPCRRACNGCGRRVRPLRIVG
jgi:hypothetical protein